ncbi:MAG TPA: hypothetical protein VM869_16010 [Enhygromyxa sp.]|nr:hypothetical protein [Enhygromyxa sp.]
MLSCKSESREQADENTEPTPAPAAAPLPTSEAEFLAELMPLPGDAEAIEITYAVAGPALEGEMTILIREGGHKREQWELRTIGGEATLRSAGLAIVNPDQIWSAPEGQPGELRTNLLGALARAWSGLDEAKRAAVAKAVRDWHALLDKRRAEVPGDRGQILGVPCLQTRIAAQNLCMWEEVGLFLRYEGSAFTIEATQIDRAPEVSADAFVLPPESRDATRAEPESIDFRAALDEAATGNFAELFLLVSRTQALPKLEHPQQQAAEPEAPTTETETGETGS